MNLLQQIRPAHQILQARGPQLRGQLAQFAAEYQPKGLAVIGITLVLGGAGGCAWFSAH